MGMNKTAEGDKYLDYHNETIEWTAKYWGALLGAFLDEIVDFELTIGTAVRGLCSHRLLHTDNHPRV